MRFTLQVTFYLLLAGILSAMMAIFLAPIFPDRGVLLYERSEMGVKRMVLMDMRRRLDVRLHVTSPRVTGIEFRRNWSEDGRLLAYLVLDPQTGNVYLEILDLQNGTAKSFQFPNETVTDPAWSPDSTHIAFTRWFFRDRGGRIDILNIATGEQRALSPLLQHESVISWSSDGQWLTYHGSNEWNMDIYALNLQTDEERRITDHISIDRYPVWSPDGNRIAFTSWRDGTQDFSEIYLVDVTTGEEQRLTDHIGPSRLPVWSPDGRQLVFVSRRIRNYDLYLYDLSAQRERRLTATRFDEDVPAWFDMDTGLMLAGYLTNLE